MISSFLIGLSIISLIIWLYLLLFWGDFWWTNRSFIIPKINLESYPSVSVVIPARNEAEVLPVSISSLLCQDYQGIFSLVLVDDQSDDNTGKIAQEIAEKLDKSNRLTVIQSEDLPASWSGKLWALHQGIKYAQSQVSRPDYFLLTDADIEHDTNNLTQLVNKATEDNLDLVSLMVKLRCESFWERFLIPAFVFFFQKLYPFPWVNDPQKKTAAAAGGCILIRREALNRIGGIETLRQALIDDCTLAQAVKSSRLNNQPTSIWLGLTKTTHSLRSYTTLKSIWDLVARTAFTQLNYSPFLLIGTLLGLTLVYLVAPLSIVLGLASGNLLLIIPGFLIWLLMAIAYFPTVKLYEISPVWALSLPAIAFLYSLMTIDSAWRYWRGKGGAWKGRVYPG